MPPWLRTAGAMLSAFVTAASLAVDALGLAPSNWPLTLFAFIGFVLFVGLIWWEIATLNHRLNEYKNARPTFELGLLEVRENVLCLTVKNTSEFRANVTARAKAICQLGNDAQSAPSTEPFLLTWEEVNTINTMSIDLNPGDHGTIPLFSYVSDGDIHYFNFYSARYGQRHEFPFLGHKSSDPEYDIGLTIDLHSSPSAKGGEHWQFRLQCRHQSKGWHLQPVESI